MTAPAKVTRPALRYYGGKWNLAPWILEHFPEHMCYVEPFGGGGSVLMRKAPSRVEVYNDLDGEVVNFFRVLREQPEELVRALTLTPYARAELELTNEPAADPLERARRLFVRCWMSRGGARHTWKPGWRFQRNTLMRRDIVADWTEVDRLVDVASRLRAVQIESGDAFDIIPRYDAPDTLFYCDPPYVVHSRSERWQKNGYRHEMAEEDHGRLAELLRGIRGMAIVSGYDTELYREAFAGWEMATRSAYTEGSSLIQRRPRRVEVLWISPAATARARQRRLT
ncbi:MAG: DNA adenine methylase [Pseudomonadales bacterium]